MICVAGGVYNEYCMHPNWWELYGSGGRAATAISKLGKRVTLHTYLDEQALADFTCRSLLDDNLKLAPTQISSSISFSYIHSLATPAIHRDHKQYPSLKVDGEAVIRFGMLEGDAIVRAKRAVYDPQNSGALIPFHENGSTADDLAIVLNHAEAQAMTGKQRDLLQLCEAVSQHQRATVVVLKMGPLGAVVWSAGQLSEVPAYKTSFVWKIGSGDTFVAHFANAWFAGADPHDAAVAASLATAYYCQHRALPNLSQLASFSPQPLDLRRRDELNKIPKVYLAGPFFNLPQRWMVDQARIKLREFGLSTFSPWHDVGPGPAAAVVPKDLQGIRDCDLLFAIVDGLDPGTIYEVGYARALGKGVVVYSESESEEDKKMMSGSGCQLYSDFSTSIYASLWTALQK